jgi:hypothetical protein
MSLMRCQICERTFESEQSRAMPFCSDRCRLIDLNRWLDEAYGVGREPEEEAEDTRTGQ